MFENFIKSMFCNHFIFFRKNQTEKYWSNVLGDLLKIAEFCFPSLSVTICYEVKIIN